MFNKNNTWVYNNTNLKSVDDGINVYSVQNKMLDYGMDMWSSYI